MNKVAIYGGLGNQMFQYALCVVLNEKGYKSRISFSNFFYETHHNGFNLSNAFKLKLPFPFSFYIFLLGYGRLFFTNKISHYLIRRLVTKYRKFGPQPYKEQTEFVFDENVFSKQEKLIIGTWQVEEYFKDFSNVIIEKFTFNIPTDKINRGILKKINNTNSVSIHIRRGDYLKSEWSESHLVIKDKTYYENAIAFINSRVENPQFYCFSDDIDWVKENLNIPNCSFIDHNNGKDSYNDMYLMSLCKHNIIANSTFSWWGAWLNKNEDKIVIMPERWLNNQTTAGIFPSTWVKLKV